VSTVGIDKERLPRHVAVIMDGNGRWAQRRGLNRNEGHKRGKDAVRAVVETSRELGLEYLTLYSFSSENWQRPVSEVRALMSLLHRYLRTELQRMMKKNIRLCAVGNLHRLPLAVRKALEHAIFTTRHNDGLTVVLAISYGAREEILAAVRALAAEARAGRLDPAAIDEKLFAQHLWTKDFPDPDLLIRTGNEFRLSNFLLWQLAYTEIYVTDTLWPDFGRDEFLRALADYQGRERRFGRTAKQPLPAELSRAVR
jgi:undecaprenyl diphosphate synthase